MAHSNAIADSRQTSLATLASEINAHHQAAEEAAFSALDHARAAGDLLIEAKGRCKHGSWSDWLVANFRGSERTAQRYMKLATGWAELEAKTTRVSDLSLREAVKLLETPREAKPETTHLRQRPFAELPTESRKELCAKWFDIFASQVLLYSMAGMSEEEIAEITQMPMRDVSLVLDPDPPIRGANGLDKTMGNPALFVAYRKAVEGEITSVISRMYQLAAWNAAREGYPELAPMLEAQSRLFQRRADRLRDWEIEVMDAFRTMGKGGPEAIYLCMAEDARIGLGIVPPPPPGVEGTLFTAYTDWQERVKQFMESAP
jgi:hypothetical protein